MVTPLNFAHLNNFITSHSLCRVQNFNHRQRARRRLAGVRRTGDEARRFSPTMEGKDEPVEAVLGRWSPATEGWWRGGAPEATNGGGLSSSRGRRRA
jgi:hypothetical protein